MIFYVSITGCLQEATANGKHGNQSLACCPGGETECITANLDEVRFNQKDETYWNQQPSYTAMIYM